VTPGYSRRTTLWFEEADAIDDALKARFPGVAGDPEEEEPPPSPP
jgi:hypothetical protein